MNRKNLIEKLFINPKSLSKKEVRIIKRYIRDGMGEKRAIKIRILYDPEINELVEAHEETICRSSRTLFSFPNGMFKFIGYL